MLILCINILVIQIRNYHFAWAAIRCSNSYTRRSQKPGVIGLFLYDIRGLFTVKWNSHFSALSPEKIVIADRMWIIESNYYLTKQYWDFSQHWNSKCVLLKSASSHYGSAQKYLSFDCYSGFLEKLVTSLHTIFDIQ